MIAKSKQDKLNSISRRHQISVCLCTFHRPELLLRALTSIVAQATNSEFSYEVVVVDNDHQRSAEATVRSCRLGNANQIIYDCEPEQNIALARNRAIKNATGDMIAFIDDDEYPQEDWLLIMLECLQQYSADGVLGPVLPDFPPEAPAWLIRSGLCERRRNKTGSIVTSRDLRTGNILLQRDVFKLNDIWFDSARGRTGGEDGDFLSRQMQKGRRFVWCDEGIVFESVLQDRWFAMFHLEKHFRIGTVAGARLRRGRLFGPASKALILLFAYSISLLILPFTAKHIWMRVLTKISYNAGCTLSFLRLLSLRQRDQLDPSSHSSEK